MAMPRLTLMSVRATFDRVCIAVAYVFVGTLLLAIIGLLVETIMTYPLGALGFAVGVIVVRGLFLLMDRGIRRLIGKQ